MTEKFLQTAEGDQGYSPLDLRRVAAAFNQACNGGTGYGADRKTVETILDTYSENDLKKIDESFYQNFGAAMAKPGERWGLREELADEFQGPELKRLQDKLPKAPYAKSISEQLAEVEIIDVSEESAQMAADKIDEAFNGGVLGWGHNFEQVRTYLVARKPAEIARIDQLFRAKYPGQDWGIEKEMRQELSGVELANGLDLLRTDNDNYYATAAGSVHADIVELHQYWKRPTADIEHDIRTNFVAISQESVFEIDRAYKNRYGISVGDAIRHDGVVSKPFKQEMAILLKGEANETAADKQDLERFRIERDQKFYKDAANKQAWDKAWNDFSTGFEWGMKQGARHRVRSRGF